NITSAKWATGTTRSLDEVVTKADQPATQAALKALDTAVLAIPGVSEPVTTRPSVDGTVALVSYTLAGSQNDPVNHAIVQQVRGDVVPRVFGSLPGVRA